MTTVNVDKLCALNGPLMQEIDHVISREAGNYVRAAAAGASASMNGALDYTAFAVVELVRKHLLAEDGE